MTVELLHTEANHPDFAALTKRLDDEFFAIYGDVYLSYLPLNARNDIRLVVVYVNGRPAACGGLKCIDPQTAELKRIFVCPQHRRQGLAQRVVRGLEEAALSEGFSRTVLETGADMSAAITLYEKLGYTLTNNYGPYAGDDACVCMTKELKPDAFKHPCTPLFYFQGDQPMGKHDELSKAGTALPVIGEKGALLVTGTDKPNVMTIGWAMTSVMWYRNLFIAPVRHSRFSHSLLEAHGEFTVFVPAQNMKKIIAVCGTKSGRDTDKITECGLALAPSQTVAVPHISAPGLVIECRVIYQTDLIDSALDDDVRRRFYSGSDAGDMHTLYFGEIRAQYEQ